MSLKETDGRNFGKNEKNYQNTVIAETNEKLKSKLLDVGPDKNLPGKDNIVISPEYIDLEFISESEANHYCPYCKSNEWRWTQTLPMTTELFYLFLIQEFKCKTCRRKFIVTRRAHAVIVKSAEKCYICNNPYIKKISRPHSPIEIFHCKKCLSFMGIKKY